MKQKNCDIIFSTFGPASNHLVAYALKKIFKKPWIADFRDLWATNKNLIMPTPIHRKIHLWLEQMVVRTADKVIGVGEHINVELKRHTSHRAKFVVLSNGYDGELIQQLKEQDPISPQDYFTMVYTGSFYRKRSPEVFLKAVTKLVEQGRVPLNKIRIHFVSNFKIADSEYASIKPALTIRGLTSHREALEIMVRADAFLLIVENELKHQIVNAKFFDYVAFQKSILALVGDQSVCLPYLDQSGLAFIAHPDDQDEIAQQFFNLYQAWNEKKIRIQPNLNYIRRFDISQLSSQLAGVFEEVIRPAKPKSQKALPENEMVLSIAES